MRDFFGLTCCYLNFVCFYFQYLCEYSLKKKGARQHLYIYLPVVFRFVQILSSYNSSKYGKLETSPTAT